MVSTRTALQEIAGNINESMGVRQVELHPQLSPKVSAKDIGRRPLRKFGRLKLRHIAVDPNQPRREINPDDVHRLALSIREMGQLHPIRVRWDESIEKWIIITGERRYRAAITAGLDEIDCYFHEEEIAESEILEQQLVENLLREDLKPLDEARGYASLMTINGWNGRQVAQALYVSPSKVSRTLALLELSENVRSQVEAGEIPRSTAYELTKLDSERTQRGLADQAAAGSLTQRRTAKAVRQRKGEARSKLRGIRQTFLADNGVKVTVTSSRKVSYHEVQQALQQALEEVHLRIDNNIQLF